MVRSVNVDELPKDVRDALSTLFTSDEKAKFIHPLAQGMELNTRFARSLEPSYLVPGDLVLEKEGLGSAITTQTIVYVVWSFFNKDDPSHQMIVDAWNSRELTLPPGYDVLLAYIAPSGNLYYRPHILSHLRKVTEDELKDMAPNI